MDSTLTLAEIEKRFNDEWVLIGEPELDSDLQLVRGRVLFHSKNRDEISEADARLSPKGAAIIFTGSIPEDAVIVL